MVERLMNSWCRVDVARNKTFMDLAEETGNDKVMGLLNKHRLTNEMVCAAYACDVPLVDAITKQGCSDGSTVVRGRWRLFLWWLLWLFWW